MVSLKQTIPLHTYETYEIMYSRMGYIQVKFVENSLWKIWKDMASLGRSYYFQLCFRLSYINFIYPFLKYIDPNREYKMHTGSYETASCEMSF